jgi:hypothetical protein
VKDDVSVAQTDAYITLQIGTQTPMPIVIGDNNSCLIMQNITSYADSWALSFDLEKTPVGLLDGDFLDPTKLLSVDLITYYQGTLNW